MQGGAPFDGEGMPRQRVQLVESGVIKSLVYARQTAQKVGTTPTGHGFPLPNEFGEAPMNIVMEGGKVSVDEMVRSTERGLLVTRVWYIREVDPRTLLLTGLTRDGIYLVEGGEVVGAVNNFRFNESPVGLLGRISEAGATTLTLPREWNDYFTRTAMPPLRIPDFHMSSVSPAE